MWADRCVQKVTLRKPKVRSHERELANNRVCVCSSLLYEIKTDTLLTNHSNEGAGTHAVNYNNDRCYS